MSPRLAAIALTLGLAIAPTAAQAKDCKVAPSEKFGVTYVTSLKVTKVSCAKGKALVRAYHKCRKANGGVKGRCAKKVQGYSCTEQRSAIAIQITGKVTCRSGGRRVVHTYSQST